MRALSKTILGARRLLPLLLVITVAMPIITLGKEATTTQKVASFAEYSVAATTTPSIATTTDISAAALEAATTTVNVLGASTTDMAQDVEEYTPEDPVEESTEPALFVPAPPPPPSKRVVRKHITLDNHASHSCAAEVFRVGVTGKASAHARIMLQRATEAPYEIEIGNVPHGIDITFSKNGAYRYMQKANDRSLELAITNRPDSQKGDFSIPIIYTRKGTKDSPVICQINIVNE